MVYATIKLITEESNRKDNISGGLADHYGLAEIAALHDVSESELQKELDKGIKVEAEHTDDPELAREIALDHLVEDPKYYTKLASIEECAHLLDETTSISWLGHSGETEVSTDSFLELYDHLDINGPNFKKQIWVYDDTQKPEFEAQLTYLQTHSNGDPIVKWNIISSNMIKPFTGQNLGSGTLSLFIKKFILRQPNPNAGNRLFEEAPPSKKIEKWILDNKERFIKQYGEKDGLRNLYSTAWTMYNGENVIKEDAPANAVGTGQGVKGLTPDSVPGPCGFFANCGIFQVDSEKFINLKHGKKWKQRYKSVIDEDDPLYHGLRKFARNNPGKGIVLQNSACGSMVYFKKPKSHIHYKN